MNRVKSTPLTSDVTFFITPILTKKNYSCGPGRSALPCFLASLLELDDWLEGRVTSSVMSSATEEEEGGGGPATTATHTEDRLVTKEECTERCKGVKSWTKATSVSSCSQQREDKVREREDMQRTAAIIHTQMSYKQMTVTTRHLIGGKRCKL